MDLCRSPIASLVIAKLSTATTSPHTSSTSYTPLNPIVNRQHTFLTKVDHQLYHTPLNTILYCDIYQLSVS